MAKFRLDTVASLAKQLAFAPASVRLKQIEAAERLLVEIDPKQAYPADFITFRITGYKSKAEVGELMTGIALQHDLGLLVESASESLDLRATDSIDPILTIDDLTERFNVTSKTIQRWRKRGLASRRYTFGDGKSRVGFTLASVERFISLHGEQVERGANFTQVGDDERDAILRNARRLAGKCVCCVRQITRRLARKFARSPLTILHIVKKFDSENPDQAIFVHAPVELEKHTKLRVIRAVEKGMPIARAARRVKRSRSDIHGVLLEDRISRVSERRVKFIDDPLYHQPDVQQRLDEMLASGELAENAQESVRIPKGLPPYLRALYDTPLLTKSQERALFLQFNYYKYLFSSLRSRLDPEIARHRDLDRLEEQLDLATSVKNRIVQANLRLVVSVARKHLQPGVSLMDLVSEGNIILMRAVESFDTLRGNKFSTYATFALMKGFARLVPALRSKMANGTDLGQDTSSRREIEDVSSPSPERILALQDEVRHLLNRLSTAERAIIAARFGLDDTDQGATVTDTRDRLAKSLGMSNDRVRGIENRALAKLRRLCAVKQ